MLLEGRTAIVSGIGPGLGRSAALAFAKEGANLVLAARTAASLDKVAAEIAAFGVQSLCIPTDITKPDQVKHLAEEAFDRFGRIDVLVNNAFAGGPYEFVVDADVDEWRVALDVNVVGTMTVCKFIVPYMLKAQCGSVINISSRIMRQGMMRRSAYSASKAALVLFSQSLADEVGQDQVRVNCVVPGHIWSDRLKTFYEQRAKMLDKTYDEVHSMYTDMMALKRIPTPEEISNTIIFLASDLSSAITGQTVDVNAGHYYH